jgi:hypothetical protein
MFMVHRYVLWRDLMERIGLTPVADLTQELGGGQRRTRVGKEREEDLAVAMDANGIGDSRFDHPDLLDDWTQGGEQRKHGRPACRLLRLLRPPLGSRSQLGQKVHGRHPPQ